VGIPTYVVTVIFKSQWMIIRSNAVVPNDWDTFSWKVCNVSWLSKLRPASAE
jgi:hypothetical protein